MQTVAGDGIVGIKRRRRDQYSDNVRNLAMTSGRSLGWDEVVRVKIPKCMSWLDAYDEPIGDLDMMEDKDLGLNTCKHDIPLSSREVPIFDELEPQPQPLLNCLSLDASLGNERGPGPPIKPPSPDSFRMKEVDHLTIHIPLSPHVSSFHLRDLYCDYRPCVDDLKKHYGFKPGLLGHSGALGVDFSKLGMIGDDWKLESEEVSLLGRGLNSPRYVRLDNQSIERDRLNEIGFLLDFIVTTSRYVVPTGRVKVPAGRYVVPTGKDNVIVSAGRTKVIPAGRTILVLQIDRRISNKEIIMILHPVSVEEHIVVQRETKARTILLQSLPEDHMADFYHLDDARDIWLAVKSRFRGNDESKKMRKSMLKQEFSEFRITYEDFDQIRKLDLEELDIKWQMAMLSGELKILKESWKKDEGSSWILKQDHEGEDEEKGDAQVYGMIAGDDDDAAGDASGDVSDAAAEFALMGLSSQVKLEESKARFVKAVGMHVVPSPITRTFMPPSNKPDLDDTQVTYGSNDKSSNSETIGFASYVSSVKSSSSKTNEHLASASSSVDFKTVSKTADQKPCSTIDDPSFSFKENVTTPRNICDKNGINNRSHCKNNSFVFLVLRLALFMHYIPSFVPRAAYVPADSRNLPSSVSAGSAFPAGSRNRPASVSADGECCLRSQQVVLGKIKRPLSSGDSKKTTGGSHHSTGFNS
ncbi:hypothetical protein Tco_0834698 [Tanacetum coccineum]